MRQNHGCSNHRNQHVALVFFAAISALVGSGLVIRGREPQQSKTAKLSVEDSRPVAKAIMILESTYGWVITYEDPPYAYAGDIDDITQKVRKDLDKFKPGQAPKVLIPKERTLSFEYDVDQTNLPSDPAIVVQRLLAENRKSGGSSEFRLEKVAKTIHVIPSSIKDKSGKLTHTKPVLDAVIGLPAKQRNGLQTLEAICDAISKAAHVRVVVGTVPIRLLVHHEDKKALKFGKAREALVEFLQRLGTGVHFSWQLLYGPDVKMYALNIHVV
jgi:hypothetical protein